MRYEDLLHDVNVLVTAALAEARQVGASALGLDNRACWSYIRVTEEFIAVPLAQDRSMRYYGGFEYVSAEHRQVLGEWVFYSVECSRVRGHLSSVFPDLEEYEDFED